MRFRNSEDVFPSSQRKRGAKRRLGHRSSARREIRRSYPHTQGTTSHFALRPHERHFINLTLALRATGQNRKDVNGVRSGVSTGTVQHFPKPSRGIRDTSAAAFNAQFRLKDSVV